MFKVHPHLRSFFIFLFLVQFAFAQTKQKPVLNEAVNAVYQAIVRVEVVSERGASGRMMKSRATGSGVILSEDGIVVTNHHVAGKATRITCRLHNGEEIMADLLGADPMTDLAVLRLRLEDRQVDAPEFAVASFGNSELVKVGEVCFAMGSPAGLSQSVTRGIISNVAMISPTQNSFRLDGENVGELVRWLGHDAVIFPGNSGGPLVNAQGKIIGINEVGIGSLGGAIPSSLAESVSRELAENGYVARSWTGIEFQPMLKNEEKGVLVAGVIKDSPADFAGINPGDVIVRYDGEEVWARIPEDLPLFNQMAYSMPAGKEIIIDGKRDGRPMTWKLVTQRRELAFAKERELKSWGLTVRNFTLMSSLEARRKNKAGAQVHSVNRGGSSASAKPSLVPGDVIVEVDGKPVRSVNNLINLTRKIVRGKEEPVPTLVRFERNLAELLTVVKLGPETNENQPVQAWKPWVGISTQVLTRDLSSALGLPITTRGIRVAQVFPDTPAERSGIKSGDLIFRVDGQIILAHRVEDAEVFGNMIKEYRTDATIQLSGMRKNEALDFNLTLCRRPDPANELPKFEEETFEFTVRELSFADRVNERLDLNQTGLVIENIEPAGWAALAGLRQGDLLLRVQEEEPNTVDDFQRIMNKLINRKLDQIVFFVRRGIHTLFLELEPDWDQE